MLVIACPDEYRAVKACSPKNNLSSLNIGDCRDASRRLAVCALTTLCSISAKAVAEECANSSGADNATPVLCLDARDQLKGCLKYYGLPQPS